jgi:hypothetical protein
VSNFPQSTDRKDKAESSALEIGPTSMAVDVYLGLTVSGFCFVLKIFLTCRSLASTLASKIVSIASNT